MHIRIISVGKIKERAIQEAMGEYVKRLSAYGRAELSAVPDEPVPEKLSPALEAQVLAREGERLLRLIPGGTHLIALEVNGRPMTSEEFAAHLEGLAVAGQSDVTFVIGGTLGLSPTVLERSQLRLSLSRMTFTHQLVPLILLEQIYRAMKMIRGEPYHR